MKFTISARGKSANTPVLRFLATNFGHIAIRQIDSVFGFVERCTLYGGRLFTGEQARCSYQLKPREMLGIQDFDLDALVRLGFSRFKMLRPRGHGLTGY